MKLDTRVHLLHHLIGAVMLFSLLHYAEHRAWLEWLDAAMIRVASAGTEPETADLARAELARPSIVQIERDAFETVFADQTPLARAPLTELLGQLDARRTALLVVDIDLAPSRAERAAAGIARPLDAALAALPARGIKVVLGLPPPAASAPGATLPWLRARCADGIAFADPAVQERLGVVSRVPVDRPTLAQVAHAIHAGRGGHGEGVICALAAHEKDEAAFYAAVQGEDEHAEASDAAPVPLDAVASDWRFLRQATHAVTLRDGHASIEQAGALNRVVFLGGAYDERERFITIGGPATGVQVHAASFTSLAMQTHDAHPAYVALADIVLGVILGVVFQAMWKWFAWVAGWVRPYEYKARWFLRFYLMRLVLLISWLIPFVIGFTLVWGSSWLLVGGTWLNPGPLIIGMFLHTLALRNPHDEGGQLASHAPEVQSQPAVLRGAPPGALRALLREHPSTLLVQVPLTVLLLGLAFMH